MFIAVPVGMNYRTERLPIVTLSLIGINTLVYIVTLICALNTDGASNGWVYENLWLIPAQSGWWAYLTHMFVHEGFFHLFGNMIFLFLFGCCVEDMIGRAKFLLMYLAGGIIAGFSYIALTPDHFESMIPMGGASGAISACMGMYLLLKADNEIEFKYFLWIIFIVRAGEFELPAWVAITFWFVNDLVWLIVDLNSKHHGSGVAFGAHVGGLLAGCAMIGIYKLSSRFRKEPVEDAETHSDPFWASMHRAAAATVPKQDTGETPTIFIHDGVQQSGPFTLSHVQAMLRLGSIGQEAHYWSEGMAEWQSVTELAG